MDVSPRGINQLFHGIYEYHDFHGAAMKIIDIHGITITYTIFRPNNSHFFSKLPFSQINSDLKMFFLQSLYFLHQKTTFHWGRSSRNNKYFFAKFDKIGNFDLHKFQHSNGLASQSI